MINNQHKIIAIPELQEFSELANRIVNCCSGYTIGKNMISKIFRETKGEEIKDVITRLSLIDSYYATQMSKRLYGIDELSEELIKYTKEELVDACNSYLKNEKGILENIFDAKYGIRKNGNGAGMANSIISKYFYFLTEYNFPIYDSLAVKSHQYFEKRYPLIPPLDEKKINNYFSSMMLLKEKGGIQNIDHLDNLTWLTGKVLNGSFSMLLPIKKYKSLLNQLGLYKVNIEKKVSMDEKILKNLNEKNIPENIFSDDQTNFISYVLKK